jgi:hypothetical protein
VLQTSAGNTGAGGAFASIGAGLGMGQAIGGLGQQMLGGMNPQQAPPAFSAPPPFGAPPVAFHIVFNGQQMGPYTIDQLRPGVSSGQFSAQTPVWRQGMAGWLPAGQVPELASLFGPPPTGGGGPPPFGGGGGPPPF